MPNIPCVFHGEAMVPSVSVAMRGSSLGLSCPSGTLSLRGTSATRTIRTIRFRLHTFQ